MQYTDDKEFFASFTAREAEAAKLLDGALRGDAKDQYDLKEGISTSDLATALSPTLSRLALENYVATPTVWQEFAERNVLDNFLPQPYYNLAFNDQSNIPSNYGGDPFVPGSLPTVREYAPYPTIYFSATTSTLSLHKSGESVQLSFESIVNDNQFGLLQRFPRAFGRHAAGQEDKEAANQLVVAGGVNTAHFKSANQNLLTGNPALSVAGLSAAFAAINKQVYNGELVSGISQWALVIPRNLELTAQNIQAITSIEQDVTSGSTVTKLVTGNTLGTKFKIVVDDWLGKIAGGTTADNYWFLIPVPGQAENPNVLVNFLRGYEQPEIWVKQNGAGTDATRGSFSNDDFQTRVRHTATGGWLATSDGTADISAAGTMFSNGSGS